MWLDVCRKIMIDISCYGRYSLRRICNVWGLQNMATQVTLTEAATFLDVSRATLRNWDKDKKLVAIRNPVNGYRMYDMDELIAIKKSMGQGVLFDIPSIEKKSDGKDIKRLIGKLHSIIRDGDADSNIIVRFEEISKLLFVKLNAEQRDERVFLFTGDTSEEDYYNKIQDAYISTLINSGVDIPEKFKRINLPASTLIKCGTELSKINLSYADRDIKGLAYEDTIKGTFDKSDNQQFFTPYQVVHFMVDMMAPFIKGRICDPACGTAGFLTAISALYPNVDLTGLEVDDRLAWTSTLNLLIHGRMNFSVRALSDGGSLGSGIKPYLHCMDAILTNPPFGSDYTDSFILKRFELGKNKTSRRRGVLFIEQSWHLLKDDGVVGIIIDQSVLNAPSNVDVRAFILEHYKLLAIIDLPETTFMPYANVNASILIMKKTTSRPVQENVFFAKSNKIGRKNNGDDDIIYSCNGDAEPNSDLPLIIGDWKSYRDGKQTFGHECFIANVTENLKGDKSLRLDYVYHHPFRKKSKISLTQSKYPLVSLGELCIERNESYIPASDTDATTILFSGLANIESNTGKAVQIVTAAASIKSAVKRYEPGDVVFSKMRPALRKVSAMKFKEGGYVSSECTVLTIRTDEKNEEILTPDLLSSILRSDFVYGQIMGCVTGIGRPRISGKDLRKIMIPVPPKDVQNKALLSLQTSQTSINQLRDKAAMLSDEADLLETSTINNIARIMSGEVI